MSKTIVKPTLSLGNHIYLYRLLRADSATRFRCIAR